MSVFLLVFCNENDYVLLNKLTWEIYFIGDVASLTIKSASRCFTETQGSDHEHAQSGFPWSKWQVDSERTVPASVYFKHRTVVSFYSQRAESMAKTLADIFTWSQR